MYKKLLTRTLFATMIAILGYFAFISTDVSTSVPIRKADRQSSALSSETVEGDKVEYKSFDAQGNEIVKGSSQKVRQTGLTGIQLEDGLQLEIKMEGKDYQVTADRYGLDELGQQVLTADPGKEIVLRVDDMVIETQGPMLLNQEGIFQTEAVARFRMGDAYGHSLGLRYKPDHFLELQRDCVFQSDSDGQHVKIDADFVLFQNNEQRGIIRNGQVVSHFGNEEEGTRLDAQEIALHYEGGVKGKPFHIVQTMVSGVPARFSWPQGDLIASSFQACFDEGGKWVEELITSPDAQFSSQTQDNYRFFGRSGALSLVMIQARPLELSGRSQVTIQGTRGEGEDITLEGKAGFQTLFTDGRAASTRIFGQPEFQHRNLKGQSGNLRLFHNEHNIIFSEGAELWDDTQQVRINGDQILVTDWDKEAREINAFKFVTITYGDQEGYIQCFGDELKLMLPRQFMEIKGTPARVNRKNLTIVGARVELKQLEDELFDMVADAAANGEVELFMVTDEGTSVIKARKVRYNGRADRLEMENVLKAELPGRGQLSCKTLEMKLVDRGESKIIHSIKAFEDVLFEGAIQGDQGERVIRCQADEMQYLDKEGLITFLGRGRDVVFRDKQGVLRGRELTYNLKDGSIRGDSDRHGTTVTTINIKKDQDPQKNN